MDAWAMHENSLRNFSRVIDFLSYNYNFFRSHFIACVSALGIHIRFALVFLVDMDELCSLGLECLKKKKKENLVKRLLMRR